MEIDNVGNVVAEMVGDMKVNKEADELDILVAKVAEEVTDTVQTLVVLMRWTCLNEMDL